MKLGWRIAGIALAGMFACAEVEAELSVYIVDAGGQVRGSYVQDNLRYGWHADAFEVASIKGKKGATRTLKATLSDADVDVGGFGAQSYGTAALLHQYFQNGTSFSIVVAPQAYLPASTPFPSPEHSWTRYTVRTITAIGEASRVRPGLGDSDTDNSRYEEGLTLECDIAAVEVHQGTDPDKSGRAQEEASDKAAIEERLIREAVREELAEPSASAAPATSGSQ